MTLSEFLRVLKASKSDHRARIGSHLEVLTRRCSGVTLYPEEEHALSEIVTGLENKMQKAAYTLTYNELLPLATWLNQILAR